MGRWRRMCQAPIAHPAGEVRFVKSAAILVILLACGRLLAAESQPARWVPAVAAVERTLAQVAAEGKPLGFALGDNRLPRGGHLQGIQVRFDAVRERYIVLVSHDSESVGYLVAI